MNTCTMAMDTTTAGRSGVSTTTTARGSLNEIPTTRQTSTSESRDVRGRSFRIPSTLRAIEMWGPAIHTASGAASSSAW